MREIKFRVWDKRTNQMSLVANISFGDDGSSRTITAELAPKGQYYNGIVHGESGILMQFTGLLDRNGREIYEGDIIKASLYGRPDAARGSCVYSVVFSECEGMWVLKDERDIIMCPALYPCTGSRIDQQLEVIGNIYEHPHLLQEASD